ncbi:hypothetical protein CPC08DRAFT_817388 [Agrocybe pediades]|nr:hypothetical protein CPC08DRAFT_817388 [Agrocybe pediades]
MSAVEYFNSYPTHDPYIPGSPDTFFPNVDVQPPSTDSAQTPPSPIAKPRRSSARPARPTPPQSSVDHQNPPTSYSLKRHSTANAASPTSRKEQERQLANTPREALIQLAVGKEKQAKDAKLLLSTAILQVESLQDRLAHEKNTRKILEEEIRVLGLKSTKAVLDAQKESVRAKEDVGMYKLQLENMSRDLQRANEIVQTVERDRNEADRSLARARATARQLKEQNIVLQAREEGREEGFKEGLLQGQKQIEAALAAADVSNEESDRRASSSKHTSKRTSRRTSQPMPNVNAMVEAEVEKRVSAEKAAVARINAQNIALGMDLDRERGRTKTLQNELEDITRKNSKLQGENRDLLHELDKAKRHRRDAELERDDLRKQLDRLRAERDDLERKQSQRIRRVEEDKNRLIEEKEREVIRLREVQSARVEAEMTLKADLEKERQRVKQLEEDRARDLERERQREAEREREKRMSEETSAALAAALKAHVNAPTSSKDSSPSKHQPLPYLAMPPPPTVPMPTPTVMPSGPSNPESSGPIPGSVTFPVPRAGSSGSQRGGGRDRRGSVSSVASTMPYDLLQFPNERDRDRGLSVIPEERSARGSSPAPAPKWVTDPPIDYAARAASRASQRGGNDGWPNPNPGPGAPQWPNPIAMPQGPDAGGSYPPSYSNPNLLAPNPHVLRRNSSGSTGSYEIRVVSPTEPPSHHEYVEQDNSGSFLSPNHQSVPLPRAQPQQRVPSGYNYSTSGVTTQPSSPVIPTGSLPPGFVPQTFTDNLGRATPIWQRSDLPNAGPPVMPQGPYIPPDVPQGTSTLRGFGAPDSYAPRDGPSIPEPAIPVPPPGRGSGPTMPQEPYIPPEMPQGTSTLRGFGDYSGATPGEDMPKPVIPNIVTKGKKGKNRSAGAAEVSMPQVPFIPPVVPSGTSTMRGFGTPDVPAIGGHGYPTPVIPGAQSTPGSGPTMPQGPYVPPEMPQGTSTLRGYGDGSGATPGEGMPQPSLPAFGEGRGRNTPGVSPGIGMPEAPFIPPEPSMGTSTLRGHGAGDLPPSGGPAIPEANVPKFGTPGGIGMPEAPFIPPEAPMGTSTLRGHGAGGTPSPHGPAIPEPNVPKFGAPGGVGMPEAPFIPPDAPTGTSTLRGHRAGGTPSPHGPAIPEPNVPAFGATTPGGGVSMPEAPFIPPEAPMGTSTLRGHGGSDAGPSPYGPSIPEPHVPGRETPTEPFIPPPFNGSLPGRTPSASSGIGMPAPSVPQIVPSNSTPGPGRSPMMGPTSILKGSKKKYGNPLNKEREGVSEPPSIFGNAAPVFPHSPAGSARPLFPEGPTSWRTPAAGQATSLSGAGGWGATPSGGQVNSLSGGWGSGATPAMSNRDLPTTGERTRLSIYGPPATASPNPSAPISMPEPTVPVTMPEPVIPNIVPDDEDNGFDQTTIQNTKLNTMTSAAAKKKKKKR